ncbi:hypothetical protein COW36_23855 [bacterium (Candidatus Blackallbacteria) CG17_big_fil_post_rev_8_21_14_2_50_48_46]|uniref:POTRA domain-containing protein n=1 Tax=bacterium (Candidatus Blackallbacteria) CG17_big_fil_post_rev_8_21_14_2_50_48_46 TaxID=2014261 RepID=A0A2M7FX75_9BACT|nr:MAG: hypothetical protein COW64_18795 [bacterium (Candidatus Blackallbacteria) CG18_big_fil_WC_8_21_14_2_50_49_26]PIW13709.1 MAG: hypothetical protein COW36_23855 [bacterium (Candidatus Blackallbacteria) CG17_big_fil_post_rev_8_21_14_2_50_48_46]PIW44935.1 MAG: hypothetical protein COW20_21485 [bacterium (Candidatus Blackallbacteria) CG13_big_fil_rev_8_21_14_2_50_49_14]
MASPELPFSEPVEAYPSRKRKKRVPDYWRIMAAMLLSSILWQIWTSSLWQIQEVRPHGLSHYSTRFVLSYLDGKHLMGQHLLQVNPLVLQKELMDYPLLKSVNVERSLFPTVVNIFVIERKPTYRLFFERPNAQVYTPEHSSLMDEEGVLLNIPDTSTPAHTVLASVDKKILKMGHLPETQLNILNLLNGLYQKKQLPIQGVYNLSNPENIILRTPEINSPIWLGKPEQLSLKLGLLPSLTQITAKQSQLVESIDLRFWKHPVIKTKVPSSVLPE